MPADDDGFGPARERQKEKRSFSFRARVKGNGTDNKEYGALVAYNAHAASMKICRGSGRSDNGTTYPLSGCTRVSTPETLKNGTLVMHFGADDANGRQSCVVVVSSWAREVHVDVEDLHSELQRAAETRRADRAEWAAMPGKSIQMQTPTVPVDDGGLVPAPERPKAKRSFVFHPRVLDAGRGYAAFIVFNAYAYSMKITCGSGKAVTYPISGCTKVSTPEMVKKGALVMHFSADDANGREVCMLTVLS